MGLLTTCIFGFIFLFRVAYWAVPWEFFFVGGMWEHFWSIIRKDYGGY